MKLNDIDIDYLVRKSAEEKCEITISCSPDGEEIHIAPWKPFEYKCPHEQVM